jgi:hypothetical protein
MNTNFISAIAPSNVSLPPWLEIAIKVAPLFTTLTIVAAFVGILIAAKNLRGVALFKLIEGWRSAEVYEAFLYVNELRQAWKRDGREICILADEWVVKHFNEDGTASDQETQRFAEERQKRRCAAQFMAKMHYAVLTGYLKPDQVFAVMPESGRYLAVLAPLEDAINRFFDKKEENEGIGWNGKHWDPHNDRRISDWDHSCPKWELRSMTEAYEKWFNKPENQRKFRPVSPVTRQS